MQLQVVVSNVAANWLYQRLGFSTFAIEPRALKIGDTYHDDRWMRLVFNSGPYRSDPELDTNRPDHPSQILA